MAYHVIPDGLGAICICLTSGLVQVCDVGVGEIVDARHIVALFRHDSAVSGSSKG